MDNRFASAVRNITILAAGNITNKIAGGLMLVFLARYIGENGFGQYAFAYAFTAIFAMLPDMGLNLLLIRDVTQNPIQLSKYLGNVILLRSGLAVLAFVLTVVISLAGYVEQEKTLLVWLCAVAVLMSSLSMSFRWAFQTGTLFRFEAILLAGESLATLIASIAVLIMGYQLLAFATVRVVMAILTLIAGYYLLKKYVSHPEYIIDRVLCARLIKQALPFTGAVVCSTLYFNIDIIMLEYLTDDIQTGLYSAAYRIILFLRIIPGLFQNVSYPVIVEAHKGSEEDFLRIAERSFRYIIIVGFGLVGISTLFPGFILSMYGKNFVSASPIFQTLIWASLFYFIANVCNSILLSGHQERLIMWSSIVALIVNLAGNLVLTPRLGALGASFAIVISEGVVLAILIPHARRMVSGLSLTRLFLRPIASVFPAFLLVHLVGDMYPIIGIGGFLAVYAVLLVLTKTVPSDDIRLAYGFIKNTETIVSPGSQRDP